MILVCYIQFSMQWKHHRTPSTWSQANDICEQQGLKLLTIDSQQKEDYVAGNLNPGFGYVHTSRNKV